MRKEFTIGDREKKLSSMFLQHLFEIKDISHPTEQSNVCACVNIIITKLHAFSLSEPSCFTQVTHSASHQFKTNTLFTSFKRSVHKTKKMALMKKHHEWNTLTQLFSKSLQMHIVDVHCAHVYLKSTMNFFAKYAPC